MRAYPRKSVVFPVSVGSALLLLNLASCSNNSPGSTTAPVTTPISLSAASAAMQQKINDETPHVVTSGVVTGQVALHSVVAHSVRSRVSPDAELSLGSIWDPESGAAPQGSDFSVLNLYNGGDFICDGATNSCTNGSITIPQLESLKDFMGQALDPDFHNSNGASDNLFGRLQTTNLALCAMGHLVPADDVDTDGLPKVGPLTLAFPADTTDIVYQSIANGGCGVSTDNAGQSTSATVTAVSSANYSKEMALSLGPTNITIWLKLDSGSGTYNLMTVEDQRPSGRYAVARTIANLSGINSSGGGTVLFEYINMGSASNDAASCYTGTHWQCSYEYHRVFIDEAANAAYVVSNFGDPGDANGGTGTPTNYVQFTGAAQPSALQTCADSSSCAGTLALSFTADGQRSPNGALYPSIGNAYDGCVNIDDRSIATDATLSCDVTGASILASGGASTMIEQTRQVYAADVVATLLADTTSDTTLAFTGASDIYTAPNTR
jgi:hypothetical protein